MNAEQQQILAQREADVAQVRSLVEWTDAAKESRIAEIDAKAQAKYREASEAEKQRIEKAVVSARRAVYGVPIEGAISAGEVAQVFQGFRSAWADVLIQTPQPLEAKEELDEILDQAERTGDSQLARAAYHRGLDLNIQSIIDRYLDGKDKETKNLERYAKALQEADRIHGLEHLLTGALGERVLSG